MDSRTRIACDYSFLFKNIPLVRNGGCHVSIWLPKGISTSQSPLPLAMMSHGGGWTVGAVDSVPYNQVKYFHEHGIAVASFEYRHIPHVHLKDIREDLLDAYKYVQDKLDADLAEAGSSVTIDGTRCAIMGWSAGGSNSLWLGGDIVTYNTINGAGSLPPLRAIISSYPLSKLELFAAPSKQWDDYKSTHEDVRKAWQQLLEQECNTTYKVEIARLSQATKTDDSTQNDNVSVSCPRLTVAGGAIASQVLSTLLVGQDAPFPRGTSAIDLIDPHFPPTCMLVAGEDKLLPIQQTIDVYDALQDAGVDSLLVTCEGMEHGEAECLPGNNWREKWWDEAIKPSLDFAIQRMKA